MKYLLVLVVVLAAMGLWRARRDRDSSLVPKTRQKMQAISIPMVACTYCGLHISRDDAVLDQHDHWFCTVEHLQAAKHTKP